MVLVGIGFEVACPLYCDRLTEYLITQRVQSARVNWDPSAFCAVRSRKLADGRNTNNRLCTAVLESLFALHWVQVYDYRHTTPDPPEGNGLRDESIFATGGQISPKVSQRAINSRLLMLLF